MNAASKETINDTRSGFLRVFLITFLIALSIRIFIAQPFIVNGASMEPTFKSGEYLVVDELTYNFRPPERGDVIVFRFPQNQSKFFIKRIIGLPNETVNITSFGISVSQEDGTEIILREPYIAAAAERRDMKTLGSDEYYVLGDNRLSSSDSRVWGAVNEDLIIGRAIARFLPITKLSFLPGKFTH